MLPTLRWSLRLPRPHTRAFATRATPSPPGPRGRFPKHAPPKRRIPAYSSKPPGNTPPPPPNDPTETPKNAPHEPSKVEAVSNALSTTPDSENTLITPVHIPEDPHGVLKETHPAMRLLDNSTLVVQRQLEMMNVLMGFEQANRYVIMDPHGNHVGYLAERDHGLGNAMARQMFKTHRSFTTHVFDREEREILRFHRPFSWINSRIRVYDAVAADGAAYTHSTSLQGISPDSIVSQTSANISSMPLSDMRIIGSAEQEWGLMRRKYNLFLARNLDDSAAAPGTPQLSSGDLPLSNSKAVAVAEGDSREVGMVQFARVDEPFLSWDFSLMSEDGRLVGSVNRNFAGFAREIFTDTGVYALRMDSAALSTEPSHLISQTNEGGKSSMKGYPGMTLDQRAVMLATAVSIDFDYFSRHSGSGGMMPMWMPMWMGGGEAAGGAAAGGAAAGEAGVVGAGAGAIEAAGETGIAGAGAAARGLGSAEGVATGAATMAGYEAMQRGRGATQADDMSPQATDPYQANPVDQPQSPPGQEGEDIWGQKDDPWAQNNNQGQDPWGQQGGSESGGDGGGDSDWDDWF
ncbi:hypothetical protein LEMA_P004340.1 [Plenodomus lingam JN3]|uniref:Scramblase family protein n=1 Tax=Leptosphaeria maculans (strain JN3 / isolate v23.1.3 / race Av1-4-5-6-7-8) TaxID=985895 RepID=E5AEK8_LEPMJ|nr:hypothetical protein LEMA_P004340.1 [Plenodomus lingam JN3]CBY01647.1 hypothetical protein LEMA_P004340.1 [Plenodomus lingam JN3]